MIIPSDSRCAICGVMAPNSDIAIMKTTSRSKWTGKKCSGDRKSMYVCSKCLPNLVVMLECAILKIVHIMKAENRSIIDGSEERNV